MANFDKTALANWRPTIWAQEGLRKLVGNLIVAKVVNTDYKQELAKYGDTLNVRKPITFTVNDKSASTSVSYQNATGQNAQLVLNKYKEVSFIGEDVAIIESMTGSWEQILNNAMADIAVQVDKDLIAEAANFTGSYGNQGVALDVAGVRATRKVLLDNKMPLGEFPVLIIGTQTDYDLQGQSLFAQANTAGTPEVVTNGTIGRKFGFDFHVSQYIDRTGSPTGDKNLAFHPDALTLAVRDLPLPDPGLGAVGAIARYEDISLRMVKSWSQDHQGYTIVNTLLYGVKAIRPELGVVSKGA